MGIPMSVDVRGALDEQVERTAVRDAFDRMHDADRRFSRFLPGSEVSRYGDSTVPSADLREVLDIAERFARAVRRRVLGPAARRLARHRRRGQGLGGAARGGHPGRRRPDHVLPQRRRRRRGPRRARAGPRLERRRAGPVRRAVVRHHARGARRGRGDVRHLRARRARLGRPHRAGGDRPALGHGRRRRPHHRRRAGHLRPGPRPRRRRLGVAARRRRRCSPSTPTAQLLTALQAAPA